MSRFQHPRPTRLRWVPVVVAGLSAALALGGCSAGQSTETSTQVGAVGGGRGDVKVSGEPVMSIRNATLAYPKEGDLYREGSSAPLDAVLINQGNKDNKLVGASTPYAQSVTIGGTTDLPAHTTLRALGQNTPSVEGFPADQPTVDIQVQGLNRDIRPGVTIPVTFTFAKSGAVTVQVPIGPSPEPRPNTEGEEGH